MAQLISSSVLSSIQGIFGAKCVFSDAASCATYSYDYSRYQAMPDCVVFISHVEQLPAFIEICRNESIPIVARGAGTGTPGGAVPIEGGIVLSFEKMNRIIEINSDSGYVVTEAGVINQDLQNAVGEHGYFWAPDPSSAAICTIGGNLANNAAGPRAIKYGTTRENTLGITAVDGQGHLLFFGGYTSKNVDGYDLTRLIVGSEGTLAIITEAILKLTPLPEVKKTCRAFYNSFTAAAEAITALMSSGTIPHALEFMDEGSLQVIRDNGDVAIPQNAKALLLIDIDGPASAIDSLSEEIVEAVKNKGLLELSIPDDPALAWQERKSLSPCLRKIFPNRINEDLVVPVGQMLTFLTAANALSQKYNIPIVNFGHGGNGNIHVNLLCDSKNEQEATVAEKCLQEIFQTVVELRGALSGEHGIGIEKAAYLHYTIDENVLNRMKSIKKVFDPDNILNPGKVLL